MGCGPVTVVAGAGEGSGMDGAAAVGEAAGVAVREGPPASHANASKARSSVEVGSSSLMRAWYG